MLDSNFFSCTSYCFHSIICDRGVSLHEVMETLGDQLAEELLSNLTDELETIFSDYADTFVGEI